MIAPSCGPLTVAAGVRHDGVSAPFPSCLARAARAVAVIVAVRARPGCSSTPCVASVNY
jgi:hypothetical protein